jgi:hypothetical protein
MYSKYEKVGFANFRPGISIPSTPEEPSKPTVLFYQDGSFLPSCREKEYFPGFGTKNVWCRKPGNTLIHGISDVRRVCRKVLSW